ncbi:hypothetical protein FQN52_004005 [Onygenales sp. PD_12]|nr:hypothetical protein FQN52_004005 [Onygenales sp. PD_12]KAK2802160.1 hypothetical protein FQN51_004841 [Onygenales sp. PD_10]
MAFSRQKSGEKGSRTRAVPSSCCEDDQPTPSSCILRAETIQSEAREQRRRRTLRTRAPREHEACELLGTGGWIRAAEDATMAPAEVLGKLPAWNDMRCQRWARPSTLTDVWMITSNELAVEQPTGISHGHLETRPRAWLPRCLAPGCLASGGPRRRGGGESRCRQERR